MTEYQVIGPQNPTYSIEYTLKGEGKEDLPLLFTIHQIGQNAVTNVWDMSTEEPSRLIREKVHLRTQALPYLFVQIYDRLTTARHFKVERFSWDDQADMTEAFHRSIAELVS